MGYHVEFVDSVRDYLVRVDGLTDEDRAAVVDGAIEELSRDADRFLALRPLAHESHCFRYDYPHLTAKTLYTFDYIVDTSHREMGVVRVAYCRMCHRVDPVNAILVPKRSLGTRIVESGRRK